MAAAVDVWLLDSRGIDDAAVATLHDMLGEAERERCRRFVRPQRRRQFVLGRALLRQSLGAMLGVDPATVVLGERASMAPRLDAPALPFASLSISHSAHWVACAASTELAIGVDIEVLDPARDIAALAEHSFTAEQAAWLASRPEASRLRDFYALWCTQEARIKMGQQGGHDHVLAHSEVALALCCAAALRYPPRIVPSVLQYR